MNFAMLRMGTLKAERNSMRDDIADVIDPEVTDGDLDAGANDAEPEPTMMSFFNGKP
jgi:hypothetical protein